MQVYICLCGTKLESKTHTVCECKIEMEDRHAFEEVKRKFDKCDMEELFRLIVE